MNLVDPLVTGRRLTSMADLAAELLRAPTGTHLCASDAGGSAVALLVRQLHNQLGDKRPLLVVVPSSEAAVALHADLRLTLGDQIDAGGGSLRSSLVVVGGPPPRAHLQQLPDRRATQQTLTAVLRMHSLQRPDGCTLPAAQVIIVVAEQLLARVPSWQQLDGHTQLLRPYESVDRDELLGRLSALGYLRAPLVEDPASVAARGSLLDVWPPGDERPARIELDGDDILSIKRFNPDDQRSGANVEELWLPPARPAPLDDPTCLRAASRLREVCDHVNYPSAKTRALIDDVTLGRSFFGADGFTPALVDLEPLVSQLPSAAAVVMVEPSEIARVLSELDDQLSQDELELNDDPHFPRDALSVAPSTLNDWLLAHSAIGLNNAPILGDDHHSALARLARVDDDTPSLACRDQAELSRRISQARLSGGHVASLDPLIAALSAWQQAGLRVIVSAHATTQAERLAMMLQHRDVAVELLLDPPDGRSLLAAPRGQADVARIRVIVSDLARGAVCPTEGLALVTEEEIFGARTRQRRAKPAAKPSRMLEDLRTLAVGDFVVHTEHGIGRYEGLVHRQVGTTLVDLLCVSYLGGDKLYLPVYRLNQIHKYRGGDAKPRLDKLGGQSFARTKGRAAKKVREMADELLRLYAERKAASGIATPRVDDDYRAFEASFPYEETPDQSRAIDEVGADLEQIQPMDRLVCGDVGFGKTEVALRAAFRVAMSGRQVAVLCPTTVLAQQHKNTFSQRLNGYPVSVDVLSRFQSKKQQDAAVRGLKRGTVDVVIGTHRLLSKDVHFKQLGLLIVDEEQRFGVAAKERIKALKTNIDVLTLSATPIPRTMQMAVSGARDLSLITTPPSDRRAVRTIVTRHDPSVLREALERELTRGGQAFFVYNRINGLDERAGFVQQLVPHARIAVVHGQLSERLLERTMLDFVDGRFDILCTTAIIENGLDIPRCNTIIIDRADMFGLSQLYQLRGRVGRSRERGYCYLVLPPGGDVGDDARARMQALQQYSDLGSGFQIASLDLDMRGGGDLLGAEQSGTVAAVGFEMFCRLLDEAVQELSGEPSRHDVDTELSFDVEALLPEDYIQDVGVRLSLYKRLASADTAAQVQDLSAEMQDRFGRPPDAARRYVHLMTLKTALRKLRVLACEATPRTVTLHLRDDTPIDPASLGLLLSRRGGAYKLTPDMRLTRRSQPGEIFESGLQACDRLIDELQRLKPAC